MIDRIIYNIAGRVAAVAMLLFAAVGCQQRYELDLPLATNADEILVMEQGSIAERGTHDALMERNEIYASMWRDYQTSVAWNIGKETHHAS